jgi:hypothetical protein
VRSTVVLTVRLSGSAPAAPAQWADHVTAAGSTATTNPSTVTLQPASPSGGIPGDANDPGDFYGFGAAIIAIALAIFVIRVLFRHTSGRDQGER